jgi:multiple sugar transport system substrate-binding protein
MVKLGRRSVLGASLGLAAAGTLARPYIANAAATTVTAWWNQGFYPAEDAAFKTLVADWEKASGNKFDLSLVPSQALNEKIVSALTSGDVPDLMYADNAPGQIIPQSSWDGKLVDVSDVVKTQEAKYLDTALLGSKFYNNVAKERSYYGVPFKSSVLTIDIWKSLVEKAGFKMSDMPKTWDAFFEWFMPMQKVLRKSTRGIFALGYTLSTTGDDPNNLFNAFLIAYGGYGIVTPDGKLHTDDPKVRQAAIMSLEKLTTPFKQGYVPPGALNWGDPDNNNAFHAKQCIMTPNDTISIPVATKSTPGWYNGEIYSSAMPLGNDGKPIASQLGVELAIIPKGAKNVTVAKEFLTYMIQPKVVGDYLKNAEGRWLPVMPSIVKEDPFWLNPKDETVSTYARQGLITPTVPWFYVFNPAYGQVDAAHIWSQAEGDIIANGMSPEQAADKALKQIEAIFARYPIA